MNVKLANLVWWSAPSKASVDKINQLLDSNELGDYKIVVSPKTAFRRALNKQSKGKLVRSVTSSEKKTLYQLTKETKNGDALEYNKEASILLDSVTGKVVSVDNPELEKVIEQEIQDEQNNVTSSDINEVFEKILTDKSDIFQVKNRSSVYLVPEQDEKASKLLTTLEVILTDIHGSFTKIPIGKDTNGVKTVKEVVTQGMKDQLEEFTNLVDGIKTGLRPGTAKTLAEKIKRLEFKAESYSMLLEDQSEKIKDLIKSNRETLRNKLKEIAENTTSVEV